MINHPRRSRRAVAVAAAPVHDHDADYAALLAAVHMSFDGVAQHPMFRTDAADLFNAYLANLPAEHQVHTCSCCRRFVNDFGGLVTITAEGRSLPAMWDGDVPDFYAPAVAALKKAVAKARVTGPFLTADKVLGTPQTGTWTHFSARPQRLHKHALLTANQAAAAKREGFGTVARALTDFTPAMLAEGIRVLESDALSRAERFLSPVRWLLDLHEARARAKDARLRDNLLWRAVATAPDGFCHPRSGMVGTLLEDIAAGLPFADVKRRWEAKVHPLQYQRPQAAPSAGNLAEAERIVEKLGIARSLERRFARLDEIEAVWRPTAPKPAAAGGSVFGHLKPKGAADIDVALPAQTMTWEKFARVVLPEAQEISAYLSGNAPFTTYTTALHADAPPILRWDRDDRRNPVAWYLWHGGSPPQQYGLPSGWNRIAAICPLPTMWGDDPSPHLGEGFVLMIEGARESRTEGHTALFPECLRSELHSIRSVIEAHSRSGRLHGAESGTASGLDLRKGNKAFGYRLRVTAGGKFTDYTIDRWD